MVSPPVFVEANSSNTRIVVTLLTAEPSALKPNQRTAMLQETVKSFYIIYLCPYKTHAAESAVKTEDKNISQLFSRQEYRNPETGNLKQET